MSLTKRSLIAPLFVISAFAAGCSQGPDENAAPLAQSQTQSTQALNTPTTLTGCLKAGEAGDTFVLTTSQVRDGVTAATYDLAGSGGVNLQDHIGTLVEVTGVIRDQQHIATSEAARPADDKATGTAGTPTVQSSTQIAGRRLDVQSIRRAEGKCE